MVLVSEHTHFTKCRSFYTEQFTKRKQLSDIDSSDGAIAEGYIPIMRDDDKKSMWVSVCTVATISAHTVLYRMYADVKEPYT